MKISLISLFFLLSLKMCNTQSNITNQEEITKTIIDTIPPIPIPPKIGCKGEVPLFVKSMPRFPGCEAIQNIDDRKKCSDERIVDFIQQNLKYPIGHCSIEGTSVIRFIVEKDGSLSNFKILRNPWASAGEEAIRVLKLMPKWIPGEQDSEVARVSFTLPVRYRL